MVRREERDSKMKKVLQILAIYAFALVAAVACGQTFALKPADLAIVTTPTTTVEPKSTADGEFKPSLKKATKTVADGKTSIEFVFNDGEKVVTIRTQHSKEKPEDDVELPVDGVLYAVDASCVNEACTEVVAGLDRVKNPADSYAKAEQSVFLLAGDDLAVKNELHKTKFDDINEAFKALKPLTDPATEPAPQPVAAR